MACFMVLAALSVVARIQAVVANDLMLGCGGFIEASPTLAKLKKPTDPKLDYSHINVELYTMDRFLKDKTQCAPNGYYLVPVYDKGTFILQVQGPEGWSWEPSQVTVVVDANGCNGNEDINFRYTGFTLSGRVLGAVGGESCPNKGEGPAGVEIKLSQEKGDEVMLPEARTVSTSPGGGFKFTDLVPGRYVLTASHPKLKVEVRGSLEIDLGWGNGKVDDVFYIPGYSVEGSVVAQGNPVVGVHIYLYSDDVTEISCPEALESSSKPEHVLCHTVSDGNGRFIFADVPCGRYKLVPYYKGDNTIFDVSPSSIDITVSHGGVVITQPFQVTGFSVGGRVLDSDGNGIEGVMIFVNGVGRASTDIHGFYKLDQVTSTQYTITAEKIQYKFSTLENLMVLPNMTSLPTIKATEYALCGSVIVISNTIPRRQVALTHGPPNVKSQSKRVDDFGHFCFEVPPGEYRLTPVTTASENLSGLLFSPPFQDVIVNAPVFDIIFTQARVRISGSVLCKQRCSPQVSISLVPVSGIGLMDIQDKSKRLTKLRTESNDFVFERVFPGRYKLEIRHEPLSNFSNWDDEWCWQQKTLDVDVGTTDITGILFRQKGFWMHVESTHPATASIIQPDGVSLDINIKKGWQNFCLDEPGLHELQFSKPCVSFGMVPLQFDTANPKAVHLVGQKYRLTGKLYIEVNEYSDPSEVINNTAVIIWREDGSFVDSNKRFEVDYNSSRMGSPVLLEYSHWGRMDDKLVFAPRHTSLEEDQVLQSRKQILFYPRDTHVHIVNDGCQPEVSPFIGRPGRYIKGSVVPALEGVNITVTAKGDSLNGNLRAGDVACSVQTREDGFYTAGPLYDDTDYSVHAMKEGYHFKPLEEFSFSGQKLGQILAHIIPGEGAEERLPAVLLSLSGDDGYRKNAATGPGDIFAFDDLFPGSFFLRPLLKEYSFIPAARSIDLGSGELVEVLFTASRIAYSVLGTVRSLSGKPEEGIVMEARSDTKNYYEETVTDADGRYRLRGLLPETTYIIKVSLKEENSFGRIERALPSSVAVKVDNNDTVGVDFIVFDRPATSRRTGHVEGPALSKWQPHLSVKISSADDSSKVERVLPLPLSYFFETKDLPKGKYTIQLVLGIRERNYNFKSDMIDIDLEHYSQAHAGPLKFVLEEHHQKQDLAPAPVLPIVVGMLVIVLFTAMTRLKDSYQWSVSSEQSVVSSATVKKDIRKPAAIRKRTY